MLFPFGSAAGSDLQDPLAAPDARSAGSHRLQDGAVLERMNERIELCSRAGELDGIRVLGNVDNATPEDIGHSLHLLALLSHCPDLDQHELALDVGCFRQIDYFDHLD